MYKFFFNSIPLVIIVLSLSSCNSDNSKGVLVDQFWKAAIAHDVESLRKIVSNEKDAELFSKKGKLKFGVAFDSYEIQEISGLDVSVMATIHCYPDIVFVTKLVKTYSGFKVDVNETIKNIMHSAISNDKQTLQYCYSFLDQPMQGYLAGSKWMVHHLLKYQMNMGGKDKDQLELLSEPCETEYCLDVGTPKILLNNLNFTGQGGNFGNEGNITLFIPPSTNIAVTAGSYRVSKIDETIKLEISFKLDDMNYLNGYLFVAPELKEPEINYDNENIYTKVKTGIFLDEMNFVDAVSGQIVTESMVRNNGYRDITINTKLQGSKISKLIVYDDKSQVVEQGDKLRVSQNFMNGVEQSDSLVYLSLKQKEGSKFYIVYYIKK